MKTKLTLKSGSFYFNSTISLIRNQTCEVDLSEINKADLEGLKSYIKGGMITSSEDLSSLESKDDIKIKQPFIKVEAKPEGPKADYPTVPENVTAVPEELRKKASESVTEALNDIVVETKGYDDVTPKTVGEVVVEENILSKSEIQEFKEEYEKLSVRDLKKEVQNRGLETTATLKNDLIEILMKDDNII